MSNNAPSFDNAANNASEFLSQSEELKSQGNDAFRKGDVQGAIQFYSSALECTPININMKSKGATSNSILMTCTLLSNRAMCQLKLYEMMQQSNTKSSSNSNDKTKSKEEQQSLLKCCIDDCTLALEHLDSFPSNDGEKNRLRGKILYRRAKALSITCIMGKTHANGSSSTNTSSNMINNQDEDTMEQNLNSAAKDLLQLLTFDSTNKEAATLLRAVRGHHANLGGGMGRSRISRALDSLRKKDLGGEGDAGLEEGTTLQYLRIIQATLAEDSASAAEEVGRRGGVPMLLQIARHGNYAMVGIGKHPQQQMEQTSPPLHNGQVEKCRMASLHILSACCSHDGFVLKYAMRDNLPPPILAQIVEEEAALSNNNSGNGGSADVAVVAIALLVRLIIHWDHREVMAHFSPQIREDGTVDENNSGSIMSLGEHFPEVDSSSVCRVATAAFLWGSGEARSDTRAPRAALDLLSAWTAVNLDALGAASDACSGSSSSASNNSSSSKSLYTKASNHRITPEDVRRMKPRQVAAHRKREAEYQSTNLKRAIQHISMFFNKETGGLDSMLACAAGAVDHRLRREVGLQIGRSMSTFEEDEDVKRLVASALGCRDWRVGKEEPNGEEGGLEKLTIEELDDEDEEKEGEEGKTSERDNLKKRLLETMKRGQLTASLLIGKPNVGTWALKHGWSNGYGVSELKELISSDDSRAMSIASEIVSAAASVESSRPLLSALVQEGTLEDLLVHPDADVRSGAASCAAKIGLASKALSADQGEVMGLLDVAIELLFEEDEKDDLGKDGKSKIAAKEKALLLTKKIPLSNSSTESTSMDRGIEVMTYLAAKTFVKEKLVNGYKPEGSPANRATALQRLVEIACSPNSGDAQMAYGLAGIFNLLSVSIETLRKEAFVGKEITKEQYDQLQALGKTEEEKEAEAKMDQAEGDTTASVSERIQKLATMNVPRAMVKLLEGSKSDATQEKLLEGMNRMASEQSVRGIMIQQGCLSACLNLDKGEKPNEAEKAIVRRARCCVAKLLVTTNPNVLTVSQRSGSIGPLIKLVKDNDALDLMHFEALLSLTNLAGFGEETKNRIVAQKGIAALSYAMYSDHEMVRQAATEAMCNMVPHPEMMEHLSKPDNLRVWIAFALGYEDNFACARAAVGCLAMACPDPEIARSLVQCKNFRDMTRSLLECGQVELMHRALALIAGLIEHGGDCREAVVATGAGPFCDAYVASYQDGTKLDELNSTPAEHASFGATLNLAAEVARLLR